jgi:hypothetical protein
MPGQQAASLGGFEHGGWHVRVVPLVVLADNQQVTA